MFSLWNNCFSDFFLFEEVDRNDGTDLTRNNYSERLRCVNLHPVGDKNASWCTFTVYQFKHQLCLCFLLNVDKSPCIKSNLRFIRRDLKQEKHLSRN